MQLTVELLHSADSPRAAWIILVQRYENERLITQTYLHQLFDLSPVSSPCATSLGHLIDQVTESTKALEALGVKRGMWDCFLVLVSRQLDHQTQELWETSRGKCQSYQVQQLLEVLTGQVRALERVGVQQRQPPPLPALSVKTSHPKLQTFARPVSRGQGDAQAHTAVLQQQHRAKVLPCYCCEASHFIVNYPRFREMEPQQRRSIVIRCALGCGCLGWHNIHLGRPTRTGRQCNGRHHTILHSEHCDSRPFLGPGEMPTDEDGQLTPEEEECEEHFVISPERPDRSIHCSPSTHEFSAGLRQLWQTAHRCRQRILR